MPDVKKLITGFLILVAGASSSALILSNVGGPNSTAGPSTQTAVAAMPSPTPESNAFVNDPTDQNNFADAAGQDISSSTETQLNDPTNLTNNLSDAFLNGLVAANPDGGQTDASGNPTIAAPDNQAILQELAQGQAIKNIRVPNWDLEAAEIITVAAKNSSPDDIASYGDSLRGIINSYFVETNLQGMVDGNTDPSAAQYVGGKITDALRAMANIPVPGNAMGLQKSLVKLFVYEKNALALVSGASDDPVKTSLIFEAEQNKYETALEEFQNELQKSPVAKQLSFGAPAIHENGVLAFFKNILGIKTARAQWLTFDAANFGHLLLTYAHNIILQILKNMIMSLIQNKILAWINGSGAPRFIKNWESTMVNAYSTAAVNSINSQFACVPPAMLPNLKLLLSSPNAVGGNNACSAQFLSQLGSVNYQSFYNHFTAGGFNSYFSLFQPNGNAFGAIISMTDNAAAAGANSQQATLNETLAAQGFKSSKICANGSNPDGVSVSCVGDVTGKNAGPPPCPAGYHQVTTQNNGSCSDGSSPETTMPGIFVSHAGQSGLDSSPKLVAAANDIAGLLNAALSSLLNSLAQAAINYSTQAFNSAISGGGGSNGPQDSGIRGISLPPATVGALPAQPGVTCAPQLQTITLSTTTNSATVTLYATGGATDITCSLGGNGACPPTENPDGTPIYNWSGSGGMGAGGSFTATFNAPGTFTETVTASTDNSSSSCQVVVR